MEKKSSKITVAIVIVLIIAVIGGGFLLFNANFAKVGDQLLSRSARAVDLRDCGIEDISPLDKFARLEYANVSGGTVKSLPVLAHCVSLRKLCVSGSDFDAQQCIDFYEAHPKADLECGVMINGSRYSSLAVSAELPDRMDDGEIRLMAALRHLKTLDLTGFSVSDATYDYLNDHLPDCVITRKLVFNGQEYLNNADTIKISADIFDDPNEMKRLRYFTSLNEIDATTCDDSDALLELKNRFPQYAVRWNINVFDVQTDTLAQEIDLNRKKYSLDEFMDEFDKKLKCFHNLKKVYMLRCDLSNDDMDKLITRYSDVKFVWYVLFSSYRVRSDAVSFSALVRSKAVGRTLTEQVFEPLFKYCTDLVSLDLGHCHISDLSQITNLKNLRGLILTDNFVTDITPLSTLNKLEFIEMNKNDVGSVEPLANLKNLKMVNLHKSERITDLSSLYNHSNLNIAIFDNDVPKDEQQRFRDSNPGCMTFFEVDSDEFRGTNAEWRNAPLREKFKNSFRKWQNVTGFDEETETFSYDFENGSYTS